MTFLRHHRLTLLALLGLGGWPVAASRPVADTGVVLQVAPVFDGEPLVLNTPRYTTAQGEAVTITTCRFYLSNLRLNYADGTTYAEPASYHLVDAEEESTLTVPLAQAPAKPLHAVSFCVGVDSAANVAGAQGGDLEPGRGMYWAWHSGYINAKLEGRSPSCRTPRQEFEFHIGGFQAPYNSLRRVTLAVPAGSTGRLHLRADIGTWLRKLKLAETASVLVPGPAARAVADGYAAMFRLVPPAAPRP